MLKDIGFKNIITFIFVIASVFAFMIFSGTIKVGSDKNQTKGKIVVWGTLPYNTIQPFIEKSRTKDVEVIYQVKNSDSYERDLVDAFAAGNGPDLFIMNHQGILRNADKIFILPYTSFPKDQYLGNYIRESKIFLTNNGVLAIPFFVDPLVLYYNKQLISSSFLVGYPKTWEEFSEYAKGITVSDEYGNISIAGAAMGTYDNIPLAKDIVSMLLLQNGNPIVGDDELFGKKKAVLTASPENTESAKNALTFYTTFRDRENSMYTWNESKNNAQTEFIAGTLGLYFDRMSQIPRIRKKNPNLDFGVALVPQISATSLKKTYGEMYGIAVSKHTKNMQAAILIASRITGKDVVEGLTKAMFVAPARNDLLKRKADDDVVTLSYQSAIIADAWVDPDPKATNILMRNLIRSLNAGSLGMYTALRDFDTNLQEILDRTINKVLKGRLD